MEQLTAEAFERESRLLKKATAKTYILSHSNMLPLWSIARGAAQAGAQKQPCLRSTRLPSLLLARMMNCSATENSSSRSSTASILGRLQNYEQQGMPQGAGTPGSTAFDLGRMHRLLAALGNPHTRYPVVHVAGSKGEGTHARASAPTCVKPQTAALQTHTPRTRAKAHTWTTHTQARAPPQP